SESTDPRLLQGGLVYLERGHLKTMPFEELRDPATGRTRIRMVDIHSPHYEVARKYMIRLEPGDLEQPEMQAKLAMAAGVESSELEHLFAPIIGLHEERVGLLSSAP
ncbi:MAG: hypothetical protein O7D33_01915, partial [Chloroflexi bacterium]|nr:hypothetical protein [Chloroflexota bacterium]